MEDTGHVPMGERPAVFNDVLLEFLGEGSESTDTREETAAA
jgi:hypothetical protein